MPLAGIGRRRHGGFPDHELHRQHLRARLRAGVSQLLEQQFHPDLGELVERRLMVVSRGRTYWLNLPPFWLSPQLAMRSR
jgi:hypothetical protein